MRAAALVEAGLEIAPHQPEPVAIGGELVLGVDRGDRILEVDDRGERGFEHDVGDARRIVAADRMVAVEHQLDMQAVVAQKQHGALAGPPTTARDRARIGSPPGDVGPAVPLPAAPRSSRNARARAITCAPRVGIVARALRPARGSASVP